MALPDRLGRYAVRRRIGSGGFATVWLAYDEQLDAPVAVKVLADNWTEDHQVRTRFIEEGRYLRRVESPHVVTVYDAGELDDGRPYLVMTYADQGTLAERLEMSGLTVGQTVEVVRQVGLGLRALHDRGVLHRDIKPANVLFRTVEQGPDEDSVVRAMVGDLGLGKAYDVSSRLTMIAGTPTFVAPEQARGESPGPAADQYSLAVVTYLLLTGRPPWEHASLLVAAEPGELTPLSTPDRVFPRAVEDVVRRGLAREPDDRFPSVTDYVDALIAAMGTWGAESTQAGAPRLVLDEERTQPGSRPSPSPVSVGASGVGATRGPEPEPMPEPMPEPAPEPRPVRTIEAANDPTAGRRAAITALLVVLALVVGLVAGWFGIQQLDDQGVLSAPADTPSSIHSSRVAGDQLAG